MKRATIIYDGFCNLCSFWVDRITGWDDDNILEFIALQTDDAERRLSRVGLERKNMESVVVIEGERTCFKSTAILRMYRHLGGLFSVFYLFILIPRPLRDWAYNLVARHRYFLFGRRERCHCATAESPEAVDTQ